MNDGIIQQIGGTQQIYDKPNCVFVADFVGFPSINLVPGKLLRNGSGFNFVPNSQKDGFNILLGDYPFENEPAEGQEIIFGIRPEYLCIPNPSLKTQMSVELKPTLIEHTGNEQNVTFDLHGHEITGGLPRIADAEIGKTIPLSLDLSEISLFDLENTLRL